MIKSTKCLIAIAQTNFGTEVAGHDNFPSKIVMMVSNKWTKILHEIVGTENAKYVVAVRCAMENEQTFNDNAYATLKFAFIKNILKKHKKKCDDERIKGINVEEPCLEEEEVRFLDYGCNLNLKLHLKYIGEIYCGMRVSTWKPLVKHQTV